MCGQSWKVSEDGAMEEDEGFGLWIWGLLEVIDVAGGAETTEDGGTRRGGNGRQPLRHRKALLRPSSSVKVI